MTIQEECMQELGESIESSIQSLKTGLEVNLSHVFFRKVCRFTVSRHSKVILETVK